MSAIAGICQFGGPPVQQGLIGRVTRAMAINGPDGIHHWQDGPVALGHCLLRTTHEAVSETQPLRSPASNLTVVFDGRLDNRSELVRELSLKGAALHDSTDAELVLRAYETWGEESPCHLLGDFAFAVWDSVRQKLFCAVDHVGACPLFYAQTNHFFAFASTEEALLRIPGVTGAPDEDMVASIFIPQLPLDPAASWLRDVKSLRPGQYASITPDGGCRLHTYWRFEPGEPPAFTCDEDAQAAFLDVFGRAVRDRLRCAGGVAQMLSGGLDSASIHAMVARSGHQASAYRTYSAIADQAQNCVETRCMQSISAGGNSSVVAVPSFTGMVSAQDLHREAWTGAHPCDNSILLPALMCLAARRNGERVMLHGVSGDQTLAVPERYPAHFMHAGAWRRAWLECQGASRNNHFLLGSSPHALFLANLWTACAPGSLKAAIHRLGSSHAARVDPRLSHELVRTRQIAERMLQQRRRGAEQRMTWSSAGQAQAQALHGLNAPALGLGGYARLGKRYGIELRDPWGDRRVIQFFLDLPLQYKIRNGWTKYLVRASLTRDLHKQVLWRTGKEHLGWQFMERLMQDSRPLIEHSLGKNLGRLAGFADMTHAQSRLRRYLRNGSLDTAQSRQDRRFVYDLMVLALWIHRVCEPGQFD
jgi:asparagine synthase (glutamine-hydrolysing)